jgi:hypothetical protein
MINTSSLIPHYQPPNLTDTLISYHYCLYLVCYLTTLSFAKIILHRR